MIEQTVSAGLSWSLEPRDVVLLSILGILTEAPVSLDDLVETARGLAGPGWKPTRDVVSGSIERAVRDGSVHVSDRYGERIVSITDHGRRAFAALLRRSIPHGAHLGQTCATLKTCFLENAPIECRQRLVEDLIGHYRLELEDVRAACARCPKGRRLLDRWADQERRRIQAELGWLEGLSARRNRPARPVAERADHAEEGKP